ncbi:MAG: glycerol-3-phosphate 1-O-acyltransferase PlsY [candidate division Zixibacteria bacterium]|nr:glycerol-3-phosphate 1-O-acyltransferase PlsY [candidate division Zixibacteria bacterium]
MITLLTIIILSYLIGAFPSGIVLGRIFKGVDVRQHGSKNMGATNVFRVLGAKLAIPVLLLDMLKGTIAVVLIVHIDFGDQSMPFHWLKIIAGLAAILGHVFPIWIKFKGGKGVATAAGVLFGLMMLEVGMAIVLFIIIVTLTRYVSLGSILGTIFIPCSLIAEQAYLGIKVHDSYMVLAFILAITVVVTHRQNIKRLIRGEENKFGRKKE